MDLHEDASTNVVTATFEFPGLHKEDVSIELHDGRMTVSAESKRSEEYTDDGYAVKERRFGRWSRTLQLPAEVKVSPCMCYCGSCSGADHSCRTG